MKNLTKFFLFSLVVIIPLVIVMSTIRIALTPLFVSVEYRLPGFPPDDYGFTTEDRLTWSIYSIDYLIGNITHEELANTRLPDGTSLFNPRELVHMLDVQILTGQALQIWRVLLVCLALLFTLAWITNLKYEFVSMVKRGAFIAILMIFGVIFYLAINFNQLFTQFHQIFFEGDSWLFLLSDNLIRLFPLKFWRDIFIFIGGLSFIISGLILLVPATKPINKKS